MAIAMFSYIVLDSALLKQHYHNRKQRPILKHVFSNAEAMTSDECQRPRGGLTWRPSSWRHSLSRSKSSRFSQDLKAHLTCWVLPSQEPGTTDLKCPWVFHASVFKCKLTDPQQPALREKAALRRLRFLAAVAQPETFSRSSCEDQICDSFFPV